jgi:MoaA/NifB/PqqE/SkfB family radical SAM enzyme
MINNLYIVITDKCNKNCVFCYNEKNNVHTIKFNQMKKIYNNLKDHILEKTYITLSGGEPTIHPELFKIMCFLKNKGHYIRIITNGLLLNKKIINELILHNLNEIQISISEYDLNNKKYMTNIYKKIQNVCKYKAYFNNININYIISENVDLDFINKLINIGVKNINVSYTVPNFDRTNVSNKDYNFDLCEITKTLSQFYNINIYSTGTGKCGLLDDSSFTISSTGYLLPCPMIPLNICDLNIEFNLKKFYLLKNKIKRYKIYKCALYSNEIINDIKNNMLKNINL